MAQHTKIEGRRLRISHFRTHFANAVTIDLTGICRTRHAV
jgi:hypothetical protein